MIKQLIGVVTSWFWKKDKLNGSILHKALKRDLNPEHIFIADKEYKSYPMNRMKWLLSLDKIDKRIYIPEVFDCDDYAAALYGRMKERHGNVTVGLSWVFWKKDDGHFAGHAVNVYYCHQYDITYIIEPQNDKIFMKPDNWKILFVII